MYKDLAWEDPITKMIWVPNTINLKEKGMVFANGSDVSNWGWAAVKAIEIPLEERINHPFPGKEDEYMEYKMDMANMKMFHERDYIEALDYIGIFKPNLEPEK